MVSLFHSPATCYLAHNVCCYTFSILIFCWHERNVPSDQTFFRCSRKLVCPIKILQLQLKQHKWESSAWGREWRQWNLEIQQHCGRSSGIGWCHLKCNRENKVLKLLQITYRVKVCITLTLFKLINNNYLHHKIMEQTVMTATTKSEIRCCKYDNWKREIIVQFF